MKKCANCNHPFSKGKLLLSVWLVYKDLRCSKCGAKYEHATYNKLLVGLLTVVALVTAFLIDDYYNLGSLTFLIAAILLVILTSLSVLFLKFKKLG